MKRYKFTNTGITIEGEKAILEDLVSALREGTEPCNQISDLIYAMECEFGLVETDTEEE